MQCLFGVLRVAGQGSFHFSVDVDVDFDSCLCPPLENLVEPPLLVVMRRSTQEQLRREPPISNINALLCTLKCFRNSLFRRVSPSILEARGSGQCSYPEVVSPVDIPLHHVAFSLGEVGFETVGVAYLGALLIARFFVLLVMTMLGIEEVGKLANFVFLVNEAYFDIVQMGVLELFLEPVEWVLD